MMAVPYGRVNTVHGCGGAGTALLRARGSLAGGAGVSVICAVYLMLVAAGCRRFRM